jgi:hypothetical protein
LRKSWRRRRGRGGLKSASGIPQGGLDDVVAIVSAAGDLLDVDARALRQHSVNVVDCRICRPSSSIAARWWSRSEPAALRRFWRSACVNDRSPAARIGELAALIGRHRNRFAAVPRALSPRRFAECHRGFHCRGGARRACGRGRGGACSRHRGP